MGCGVSSVHHVVEASTCSVETPQTAEHSHPSPTIPQISPVPERAISCNTINSTSTTESDEVKQSSSDFVAMTAYTQEGSSSVRCVTSTEQEECSESVVKETLTGDRQLHSTTRVTSAEQLEDRVRRTAVIVAENGQWNSVTTTRHAEWYTSTSSVSQPPNDGVENSVSIWSHFQHIHMISY